MSTGASLPVVIFCGGPGTRMGGGRQTKKELVEVGGRAIIWHVMRIFAAFGHTHFILPLGHMGLEVKQYFLDLRVATQDLTLSLDSANQVTYHAPPEEKGWRITLADTGPASIRKGSRVYRVSHYLEDAERFFVTYGDGVGNVDINALLAFHHAHGKLVTMTGVNPRSQYGLVQVDPSGKVSGFEEKPRLDHWINAGFMVFERGTLEYLNGENVDLERETLVRLADEGELMMYRHPGYWRSMDTFKEAQELDAVWRERAPWKVW